MEPGILGKSSIYLLFSSLQRWEKGETMDRVVSLRGMSWLVVGIALIGCAPIRQYEEPQQSLGRPLSTFIGGVVFRVDRSESLPNIFGRADLYGRTRDRGFLEIRYQGMADDGTLLLRVVDINIQTNETTMSRTPMRVGTFQSSGSYSGNGVATGPYQNRSYNEQGSATQQGSYTEFQSPKSHIFVLPPNVTVA